MAKQAEQTVMDRLVSLCKRRGFVYPASEIYGGINGFWDYGPLGVQLKNNLRDAWWKQIVESPPIGPDGRPVSIVGLDSSIIQNPQTWVASGHVGGFSDPMVDDRESKQRYRADHVMVFVPKDGQGNLVAFLPGDEAEAQKKIKRGERRNPDDYDAVPLTELAVDLFGRIIAPASKEPGGLTEPREFNLMFMTYVGALADEDAKAYLRPETAQGIFLNYKNVLDTMRVKVPFGIAQVGKSFRNEVTPRNFIFRSREFEQMEIEWFCHPDEAGKWYDFWKQQRLAWWKSLGVREENLRLRDHDPDELSHYAKAGVGTVDIEYKYPFTDPDFGELEGVAHRTDFDLTAHQEASGQNMQYFDEATKQKYVPHVIEPAAGLTRGLLVLLADAFTEEEVNGEPRTVMKFKPSLAPNKAAVFPLVKKDGMPEKATAIYDDLRTEMTVVYDAGGAVGRRYRRQDEIGTPFCITVDGDTISDDTVTVRHRDSMAQERVPAGNLKQYLRDHLAG
jgi:glycyl-tRNA synthetase